MKTVVFDMDGVMIDSEYTYLESKTEILHEAGHMKDISYQYQFMGTTYDFMWQQMKDELGLPQDVAYYIDLMNKKRADMIERDGIKGIKGIEDFVKALYDAGFTLAVASSSPKVEIERAMTSLGLDQYLTVLVSGEEVAHSKPEPDVFLRAAELLGVDPKECIAIEDTRNGSLSAHRAGMYVIGFANPDYPEQDLSVCDDKVTAFDQIDIEKLSQLV